MLLLPLEGEESWGPGCSPDAGPLVGRLRDVSPGLEPEPVQGRGEAPRERRVGRRVPVPQPRGREGGLFGHRRQGEAKTVDARPRALFPLGVRFRSVVGETEISASLSIYGGSYVCVWSCPCVLGRRFSVSAHTWKISCGVSHPGVFITPTHVSVTMHICLFLASAGYIDIVDLELDTSDCCVLASADIFRTVDRQLLVTPFCCW